MQQIIVLRLGEHAIEAVLGVVRVMPAAVRRIDQTTSDVEQARQFHADRILDKSRVAIGVVAEIGGLVTGGIGRADEIAGAVGSVVGLGLGKVVGRERSQ